jgi:hypothetical protein
MLFGGIETPQLVSAFHLKRQGGRRQDTASGKR